MAFSRYMTTLSVVVSIWNIKYDSVNVTERAATLATPTLSAFVLHMTHAI